MNNNFTLGWDLGGAHVKAVLLDGEGVAQQAMQVPCPLWRGMDQLEHALDSIMASLTQAVTRHVVTMTGELVDIFDSRDAGVQSLADAMVRRFGAGRVRFYAGSYGLMAANEVPAHLADIASANWHASSTFLATRIEQALLIDVGSTTIDLVVLHQGRVAAVGYSDAERLQYGELIYGGVIRTPVMALVQRLPFNGAWQGVAAEHFATMADVYRLTGDLPEACDMSDTADGLGKSQADSARRLARMLGRDCQHADLAQWRQLARALKSSQMRVLQQGVELALSRGLLADGAPLVGAGVGRFLVRELARNMALEYLDASDWVLATTAVDDWAVACLPAYAVASLGLTGQSWQH